MATRAAAKREAAFLKESLGATSIYPPATPSAGQDNKEALPDSLNGVAPGVILPSPTPRASSKRKRTIKKSIGGPLSGGWDVLPHGLGKIGDLAEGASFGQTTLFNNQNVPPVKRTRLRNRAKSADYMMREAGSADIKLEEPMVKKNPAQFLTDVNGIDKYDNQKPAHGTPVRHRRRRAKNAAEEDVDVDVKDRDFKEDKPKEKRVACKKKAVDTTKCVLDKVDELINASGNLSKKERKKKHKYGLTPGESPFPGHAMPTAEACEEVNRLLSELHGKVEPPTVVPPPSMNVTGCGEVPDLLDAILRTKLSASTSANNANLSLKGLRDTFGLRTSGIGEGSVNWEAVHEADLLTVVESIKSGGLAKTKGTDIKKILAMVYEQNLARRHELLKEKETGKPADALGVNHETPKQKNTDLARFDQTLLSMDHIFEMTTDEAMEEITKLPGIGVKTASCVILFCMQRPSFAVDTHVWRHCKWLGWVPEKATRDQTFSHCEVRVPDHLKYSLHQLFLRHGKTCGRCRANTSAGTKEWNETVCPIEHLVSRKEARKMPGASPFKETKSTGLKKGVRGKKGKQIDDDATEESGAEFEDAMQTD